jgi:hypothetical protein
MPARRIGTPDQAFEDVQASAGCEELLEKQDKLRVFNQGSSNGE